MGMLIFQGRLLFLLLGIGSLAYLAHTMRLVTDNRWAVGFALLFTIATNLARDLHRYQARHPQLSLNRKSDGTDLRETLAQADPNPSETLESLERAEAVRRAVAGLAEDLRVPLILAVYEEKSHAEIAEILQCSAKAVEMRLYRARNELRALLEKVLA
jgi:RNA polymerase sigma-70 factor (ECF subfamily)